MKLVLLFLICLSLFFLSTSERVKFEERYLVDDQTDFQNKITIPDVSSLIQKIETMRSVISHTFSPSKDKTMPSLDIPEQIIEHFINPSEKHEHPSYYNFTIDENEKHLTFQYRAGSIMENKIIRLTLLISTLESMQRSFNSVILYRMKNAIIFFGLKNVRGLKQRLLEN